MNLKRDLKTAKLKESLATKKGRGIAAGLALVILVLVVLVIATFALPRPADEAAQLLAQRPASSPTPASTATQAATATTETATGANQAATEDTVTISAGVALKDYRDPFAPLAETTTTTGSEGNPASSGATDANSTLSLTRIAQQGGVNYATIKYQSRDYMAAVGDRIGDSAYLVTDVSDTSVSLLYGDDRLTLQLGQEIIK